MNKESILEGILDIFKAAAKDRLNNPIFDRKPIEPILVQYIIDREIKLLQEVRDCPIEYNRREYCNKKIDELKGGK